jgi:hypothetical protein
MSRAGQLLSAALLRPINLLALGIGLLLAVTWAPWWTFPLSFVAYGLMVIVTLRDPAFVKRATRVASEQDAGQPVDWARVRRDLGEGPWVMSLDRIASAERNLAGELAQSTESTHSVLASTLAQVRSAATLGVELARRLRSLDRALRGYAGMNPDLSRREAHDKRHRATATADEQARRALLEAAEVLDESAKAADSLRLLRERTAAQLDSLAAKLEGVAVRGVRLRVGSDSTSQNLSDTLGAEIEAARDTLGVLESMEEPEAASGRRVGP